MSPIPRDLRSPPPSPTEYRTLDPDDEEDRNIMDTIERDIREFNQQFDTELEFNTGTELTST